MPDRKSYFARSGIALNSCVNVILFNGVPGQTISQHAAIARERGQRWGCVMCDIFHVAIEKYHCDRQFGIDPTPMIATVRSVVSLIALIAAIFIADRLLMQLMHWLFAYL